MSLNLKPAQDGVKLELSPENQALYTTLKIIFERVGSSVEARLPIIMRNETTLERFLQANDDKGVTREGLENLMQAMGNPKGLSETPDISHAVSQIIVGGEQKGFISSERR